MAATTPPSGSSDSSLLRPSSIPEHPSSVPLPPPSEEKEKKYEFGETKPTSAGTPTTLERTAAIATPALSNSERWIQAELAKIKPSWFARLFSNKKMTDSEKKAVFLKKQMETIKTLSKDVLKRQQRVAKALEPWATRKPRKIGGLEAISLQLKVKEDLEAAVNTIKAATERLANLETIVSSIKTTSADAPVPASVDKELQKLIKQHRNQLAESAEKTKEHKDIFENEFNKFLDRELLTDEDDRKFPGVIPSGDLREDSILKDHKLFLANLWTISSTKDNPSKLSVDGWRRLISELASKAFTAKDSDYKAQENLVLLVTYLKTQQPKLLKKIEDGHPLIKWHIQQTLNELPNVWNSLFSNSPPWNRAGFLQHQQMDSPLFAFRQQQMVKISSQFPSIAGPPAQLQPINITAAKRQAEFNKRLELIKTNKPYGGISSKGFTEQEWKDLQLLEALMYFQLTLMNPKAVRDIALANMEPLSDASTRLATSPNPLLVSINALCCGYVQINEGIMSKSIKHVDNGLLFRERVLEVADYRDIQQHFPSIVKARVLLDPNIKISFREGWRDIGTLTKDEGPELEAFLKADEKEAATFNKAEINRIADILRAQVMIGIVDNDDYETLFGVMDKIATINTKLGEEWLKAHPSQLHQTYIKFMERQKAQTVVQANEFVNLKKLGTIQTEVPFKQLADQLKRGPARQLVELSENMDTLLYLRTPQYGLVITSTLDEIAKLEKEIDHVRDVSESDSPLYEAVRKLFEKFDSDPKSCLDKTKVPAGFVDMLRRKPPYQEGFGISRQEWDALTLCSTVQELYGSDHRAKSWGPNPEFQKQFREAIALLEGSANPALKALASSYEGFVKTLDINAHKDYSRLPELQQQKGLVLDRLRQAYQEMPEENIRELNERFSNCISMAWDISHRINKEFFYSDMGIELIAKTEQDEKDLKSFVDEKDPEISEKQREQVKLAVDRFKLYMMLGVKNKHFHRNIVYDKMGLIQLVEDKLKLVKEVEDKAKVDDNPVDVLYIQYCSRLEEEFTMESSRMAKGVKNPFLDNLRERISDGPFEVVRELIVRLNINSLSVSAETLKKARGYHDETIKDIVEKIAKYPNHPLKAKMEAELADASARLKKLEAEYDEQQGLERQDLRKFDNTLIGRFKVTQPLPGSRRPAASVVILGSSTPVEVILSRSDNPIISTAAQTYILFRKLKDILDPAKYQSQRKWLSSIAIATKEIQELRQRHVEFNEGLVELGKSYPGIQTLMTKFNDLVGTLPQNMLSPTDLTLWNRCDPSPLLDPKALEEILPGDNPIAKFVALKELMDAVRLGIVWGAFPADVAAMHRERIAAWNRRLGTFDPPNDITKIYDAYCEQHRSPPVVTERVAEVTTTTSTTTETVISESDKKEKDSAIGLQQLENALERGESQPFQDITFSSDNYPRNVIMFSYRILNELNSLADRRTVPQREFLSSLGSVLYSAESILWNKTFCISTDLIKSDWLKEFPALRKLVTDLDKNIRVKVRPWLNEEQQKLWKECCSESPDFQMILPGVDAPSQIQALDELMDTIRAGIVLNVFTPEKAKEYMEQLKTLQVKFDALKRHVPATTEQPQVDDNIKKYYIKYCENLKKAYDSFVETNEEFDRLAREIESNLVTEDAVPVGKREQFNALNALKEKIGALRDLLLSTPSALISPPPPSAGLLGTRASEIIAETKLKKEQETKDTHTIPTTQSVEGSGKEAKAKKAKEAKEGLILAERAAFKKSFSKIFPEIADRDTPFTLEEIARSADPLFKAGAHIYNALLIFEGDATALYEHYKKILSGKKGEELEMERIEMGRAIEALTRSRYDSPTTGTNKLSFTQSLSAAGDELRKLEEPTGSGRFEFIQIVEKHLKDLPKYHPLHAVDPDRILSDQAFTFSKMPESSKADSSSESSRVRAIESPALEPGQITILQDMKTRLSFVLARKIEKLPKGTLFTDEQIIKSLKFDELDELRSASPLDHKEIKKAVESTCIGATTALYNFVVKQLTPVTPPNKALSQADIRTEVRGLLTIIEQLEKTADKGVIDSSPLVQQFLGDLQHFGPQIELIYSWARTPSEKYRIG